MKKMQHTFELSTLQLLTFLYASTSIQVEHMNAEPETNREKTKPVRHDQLLNATCFSTLVYKLTG
jgi:hypothetical protein